MKFLKRKQIIVLSLVLMLVIAGYLQYSYNKSSQFSEEDSAQVGDAVYVENDELASDEVSATAAQKDEQSVTASKEANTYFAQAKIDRESVRDKDIETMKQITDDAQATEEIRSKAYEKMMAIVETSQKEENIETLIKEKGFSDVVALFADDGSVDIVVKAPAITKADAAKIADIVIRQGNVSYDKIVIKTMF